MQQTLAVLNDLEQQGLYQRYAIAGAMAAIFYIEAFETEDLDIMILLPADASLLAPLSQIYQTLKARGYQEQGPWIMIEGVAVQFLPAYSPLVEEAVHHASEQDYLGVPTRILSAEYLCAIMVETGRAKDRLRLEAMLDLGTVDLARFRSLIERFGLGDRLKRWMP